MVKLELENILLVVFFGFILFFGPGVILNHQIKHEFPYGYGSSDSFQHQIRAEAIKDSGNFRYEAPYISKGFENVIGRYPPVLYHVAVIFSYSSGLEVYDSIYLILILFLILSSFIMYFILKKYNKIIGLISLPFHILLFSFPISAGIFLGHWPSLMSQTFLVLLIWSITNLERKGSFIYIAISLIGTVLTHTSATIFSMFFLGLFFGLKLIFRKLNFRDIKVMSISFISMLVVTSHFILIFMNTWVKSQPYEFFVQPVWEGNPGFYILGFGLLLIPIVVGIVISLIKISEVRAVAISGIVLLIGGFMNYVGFDVRAFQVRFMWPVYLSIFFGLGIYFLIKLLIKKWNFISTGIFFVLFLLLFIGVFKIPIMFETNVQSVPYIPQDIRESSMGLMNPFHWDILKWLSEEADSKSSVYFFYGDIYSQDALLRNTKRFHVQADPDEFIKKLQERKISRGYVSEVPGDSGGVITVRHGLFKFENIELSKPREYYFESKDVCDFDYYVFDKISRHEALVAYNREISQEMLNKQFIEKVHENEVAVILKNNKPGDECIVEKTF